jgi:gamma-glutamyltranspeptidase / glutathione hydrolase
MPFTTRPVVRGRNYAVTSGHYLATAAGVRMLEQGGNAIDAAAATTVYSTHFPSSFYPRDAYPNVVEAEELLAPDTLDVLRGHGHIVNVIDSWSNGKCMGIRINDHGILEAGLSPRGEIGHAAAW